MASWACPSCGAGFFVHGTGPCSHQESTRIKTGHLPPEKQCPGFLFTTDPQLRPIRGECYHCGHKGWLDMKPTGKERVA